MLDVIEGGLGLSMRGGHGKRDEMGFSEQRDRGEKYHGFLMIDSACNCSREATSIYGRR